jgi:hypothetical protein
MTKSLCSVCGMEGILEKRGQSVRIIHYSWVDGKRIFSRHKLMGTVGNSLGTDNSVLGLIAETKPVMRARTEREGDVLAS